MTRDEKGRFVKGHPGTSPGRPPRKKEERYLDYLIENVSFEDWAIIVQKAVADAKRGDAVARKWISDYLIGPPKGEIDVNLSDIIVVRKRKNES